MTWFNESRIQRLDPLGLMPFARGGDGFLAGPFTTQAPSASPRADVHVDGNRVLVRVEVPAFGPEDIEVSLEGRILWIRGESARKSASGESNRRFERGFRMPFPIAVSDGAGPGVEAQLRNGLLEVQLDRAEADRPRRIPIGSGSQTTQAAQATQAETEDSQ